MAAPPPPVVPATTATPTPLNTAKLRARIGTVVEQPPYVPGLGGVASTEKDSHAHARAMLVLLAFTAYPLLVKHFPDTHVIVSLHEADPAEMTPVAVRRKDPASDAAVSLYLPLRSAASGRLVSPNDARRALFHALSIWRHPTDKDAAGAFEASIAASFESTLRDKVPLDWPHLQGMRVLTPDWVAVYNAATGHGAGGAGSGSSGGGGTGGSASGTDGGAAMRLWWPPPPEAVTFAEAKRLAAGRKEMAAAVAEAEKVARREAAAAAAAARSGGQ